MNAQTNILKDKIALVTGSSRGIGAAIARCFAQEGAAVVLHGRDAQALEGVRAGIEASGGKAMHITADVTRFDEIETMRHQIEKDFGPVDVLVVNAGANLSMPGPLEETSEAAWNATVEANLTSTYLTIKCFLPGMKERKAGSIITLSSAAARRPTARSPIPYAAAKAGIQAMTQIVAQQAGPEGVRVNCIAPETILTETNLERIPAAIRKTMEENHPIRRLGTPEDIAQAALFLASDQASWISGVVLDVAGGSVIT